ncbi:MAG: hypothetical protein AB1782_01510 [Cyanobacteriota bacterium]
MTANNINNIISSTVKEIVNNATGNLNSIPVFAGAGSSYKLFDDISNGEYFQSGLDAASMLLPIALSSGIGTVTPFGGFVPVSGNLLPPLTSGTTTGGAASIGGLGSVIGSTAADAFAGTAGPFGLNAVSNFSTGSGILSGLNTSSAMINALGGVIPLGIIGGATGIGYSIYNWYKNKQRENDLRRFNERFEVAKSILNPYKFGQVNIEYNPETFGTQLSKFLTDRTALDAVRFIDKDESHYRINTNNYMQDNPYINEGARIINDAIQGIQLERQNSQISNLVLSPYEYSQKPVRELTVYKNAIQAELDELNSKLDPYTTLAGTIHGQGKLQYEQALRDIDQVIADQAYRDGANYGKYTPVNAGRTDELVIRTALDQQKIKLTTQLTHWDNKAKELSNYINKLNKPSFGLLGIIYTDIKGKEKQEELSSVLKNVNKLQLRINLIDEQIKELDQKATTATELPPETLPPEIEPPQDIELPVEDTSPVLQGQVEENEFAELKNNVRKELYRSIAEVWNSAQAGKKVNRNYDREAYRLNARKFRVPADNPWHYKNFKESKPIIQAIYADALTKVNKAPAEQTPEDQDTLELARRLLSVYVAEKNAGLVSKEVLKNAGNQNFSLPLLKYAGGGGGPRKDYNNKNNVNSKIIYKLKVEKNVFKNIPVLLENRDVVSSFGYIVPARLIDSIEWIEESPKKELFNKTLSSSINKIIDTDLSIGEMGIKLSTVKKLIKYGYFPELITETDYQIIDYIKHNNRIVSGEILAAYIDVYKKEVKIDIGKDENFSILATIYNQGLSINRPQKKPIIEYWGYGMRASNYLHKKILKKQIPYPKDYKLAEITDNKIIINTKTYYNLIKNKVPSQKDNWKYFINKKYKINVNEIDLKLDFDKFLEKFENE